MRAVPYEDMKLLMHVNESFNTIYYCYSFKVKDEMKSVTQVPNLKVNRAFLVSGLLYTIYLSMEASMRIGEIEIGYIGHSDYPVTD